ncbi:MAG: hypothetical protein E7298_02740 [Lachnospiraceae bacterium]|nr:hypothetical protein [Lachnospiraceae bacterium]
MTKEKRIKFLTWPLILICLVGGICSYISAGYYYSDAVYHAINLFKFTVDADELNIGLRIFRWLAPLSVATTVFIEIAPLFMWLRNNIVFWLTPTKTIIYSDCETGDALYQSMNRKAVLHKTGNTFNLSDYAKKSVILMKNDEDALKLYGDLDGLDNRFLCLNSMEPSLIPSSGNTVICNINDIIAGYFWHKEFMSFSDNTDGIPSWRCPDKDHIHIFKDNKDREFKIIIWGYDNLGKRLLYKGLLNNIFSPFQKITYYIFDPEHNSCAYMDDISGAVSINDDKVFFYDDESKIRELSTGVDAIIIPGRIDPVRIQELLYSTKTPQLYYYDPKGIQLEKLFGNTQDPIIKKLHSFGADKEILKEKYILHSGLLDKAKEINNNYFKEHPEKGKKWEELSGFDKGSNVNCADYLEVGYTIRSWNLFSIEELASLEHIRWYRYIYLNHSSENKAEKLMVPYKELPENEKEKDRENVRLWKD